MRRVIRDAEHVREMNGAVDGERSTDSACGLREAVGRGMWRWVAVEHRRGSALLLA